MEQGKNTRRKPRLAARIAGVILLLAVLLVLGVAVLFGGELATLCSIERVGEANFFTMDVQMDYGLDEFLTTGASSDAELVSFLTRRLLKGIPMNFDLPDLGCSTFAAQLSDGTPIFARNFDMYDSPALLVTTHPKDGYASISMVNLAYIGYSAEKLPIGLKNSLMTLAAPYVPLDGVNEAGLAVGVLLIDTEPTNQQTEKVDITTTSAIRMMLDRAATVGEAVALLEQYDMHASANSCYHFHIADAQGGSVVVEYIGDEMNVVDSRMATNFLLTPGDWDFNMGEDRFAVLEAAFAENGGVFESTAGAMSLLESVSQDKISEKTGEYTGTQWSCVYDLNAASVEVAIGRNYGEVYTFGLRR